MTGAFIKKRCLDTEINVQKWKMIRRDTERTLCEDEARD